MSAVVNLVGRGMLSAIFIGSAVGQALNLERTLSYMELHGMPAPLLFLVLAILVELLGGLSLLLGIKARCGGLSLFFFLLTATLIFHTDFSDEVQQIMFMKNLAIMGGLLMVAANGSGSLSLEDSCRKDGPGC